MKTLNDQLAHKKTHLNNKSASRWVFELFIWLSRKCGERGIRTFL